MLEKNRNVVNKKISRTLYKKNSKLCEKKILSRMRKKGFMRKSLSGMIKSLSCLKIYQGPSGKV